MIAGRVLDASAVLDLTRGSTVYAATLLSVATDLAIPMVIPTTALQQTWHALEPEQHLFLELLLGLGVVILHLETKCSSFARMACTTSPGRPSSMADPEIPASRAVPRRCRVRRQTWPGLTTEQARHRGAVTAQPVPGA